MFSLPFLSVVVYCTQGSATRQLTLAPTSIPQCSSLAVLITRRGIVHAVVCCATYPMSSVYRAVDADKTPRPGLTLTLTLGAKGHNGGVQRGELNDTGLIS